MPELPRQLDLLAQRLDHMAMLVQRAVHAGLRALAEADADAGEQIDADDYRIDREEVEIEQDCIDLLALYQPAAIDLRRILCVVKVNNDLERIGDIAARLGRRAKHVAAGEIRLEDYAAYPLLAEATQRIVDMTVQSLRADQPDLPRAIIAADRQIDAAYSDFAREVLEDRQPFTDTDTVLTLVLVARALERIGDHCTNIAEDILYRITGNIVRHGEARRMPLP